MTQLPGTTGLIFDEPLLWEKGGKGRSGFSLPENDVGSFPLPADLSGEAPDLPDLSEVEVVRHYTRLSQWNFGVDSGMYPLGSCTMKYNPKTNERQACLPGFQGAHPLLPDALCQGSLQLIHNLELLLAEITGMAAVSLQPAAGAQGELAGMLMLHAYHSKKGKQPTKIIIPDTAHGTNPASAALCGYKPVTISSNKEGILDLHDIEALMDEETAGIMITNPNTLGLFEKNLPAIAQVVHDRGGLVYCDGANMNAMLGKVKIAELGVDIIHLNLHKTFATPHGGGGPGAGPIAVSRELEPFLPLPRVVKNNTTYTLQEDFPDSIGRLLTFNGHFAVLIRAYSYILSLGHDLPKVTDYAVLNATYIKERLRNTLHLAYDQPCLHECVFSDKNQQPFGVSSLDMAKRLIDFGFHPPTIYFPLVVPGAIMIEPTETECKEDIDLFISAFEQIAGEAKTNPEILHEAPHNTKVRRLDETNAARKPRLCG